MRESFANNRCSIVAKLSSPSILDDASTGSPNVDNCSQVSKVIGMKAGARNLLLGNEMQLVMETPSPSLPSGRAGDVCSIEPVEEHGEN
jgi:hypothetical protein